jgi:ABC-2 type transport system permease protein
MNLFLREMKAHRKSLIIWSIGLIFMVVSGMSKYAGMSGTGQSMNDLMADMPKSLQAIMGTGVFDLSKASGYYGVLYIYLLLMGTIHAVMIGSNILAKEERDKTSEFLFVKPISRSQIVTSKLAAALTNIIIINLITLVTSISIVVHYSNGEEGVIGEILTLIGGMFILQLLFMLLGSGIASVARNPKRASSWSTSILLICFIFSIVIDLNENLEFLKFLTPFKYFDAKNMMYGGGYDFIFFILSIVFIGLFLVVTYVSFQKRDLKV